MALQCLAILGTNNEPLYLLDTSEKDDSSPSEPEDCFGFTDPAWQKANRSSTLSIQHEFMIHAALDRLEELLGGKQNTVARWQRGSRWIGVICRMEHTEIYGYVTASNIKLLAMIRQDEIIPLKTTKESDIKLLFAKTHESYVKYTMNPFSTIRAKIDEPCGEFEKGVQSAIALYRDAIAARATAN